MAVYFQRRYWARADRQSIKLQEAPTRASSLVVCYAFGRLTVSAAVKPGYRREAWQYTCGEVVTCWKSHRFQFAVRNKFYPQVSAATPDIGRAVLTAVASEHWGEAKGSIPNLDVVKFTFPRGLDGIILLKVQIDTLPRRRWKTQFKKKEEKKKMIANRLKAWSEILVVKLPLMSNQPAA